MPALTNVDVVRALLWLGMRGVAIPDRVIAFALEEDFTETPASHPYAVACALLDAADEVLVLMGSERRPPQSLYASQVGKVDPDVQPPHPRGADPMG